MLSMPFPVTNEEIPPICDSMDIGGQNRVLSIASGGCLPVAFATFEAKTHAVDSNLMQLSQAIQRTWFFVNGVTGEFLRGYNTDTPRGRVNREFMSGRSEHGDKVEKLLRFEEGNIFHIWYKNLSVFDRIYLSNAYGGIPRELISNLKKTPDGTIIYTSATGDFEDSLSAGGLLETFKNVFEKDDLRTQKANNMVDPFWTPAIYRKKG